MSDHKPSESPSAARTSSPNRARIFAILGLVLLLLALVFGVWTFLHRNEESTDDAYVNGHQVAVTSQVAGTVVAVLADDTDRVTTGMPLVKLDPADAEVMRQQAETQLAKTVRTVRNAFATVAQLEAAVDQRRSDLVRARDDLAHRQGLVKAGAVSEEELRHTREAERSAEAGLALAERQLAAARALVDGTEVATHPDVLNAASHVRDAYLALSRTTIPAPISGTVGRRTVQVGARVSPGTPLMSVMPLDQVWVDANFKEVQLAHVRVGQPATLTADLYGGKVTYHGRVRGFGAGTGGAFALLPPQNATGNWVKVVQRLPVRIALDPQEIAAHPLQLGLSMTVTIDTADQSGPAMTREATPDQQATTVFADAEKGADSRIAAIIAANLAPARGGSDH